MTRQEIEWELEVLDSREFDVYMIDHWREREREELRKIAQRRQELQVELNKLN